MEDIKDYLKKKLKIRIKSKSRAYGLSGDIEVSLTLEGEEISSSSVSGSDIENTFADKGYE